MSDEVKPEIEPFQIALSDEELKTIETRPDRAHSFAEHPDCGCGECTGYDVAYELHVVPLLAEIRESRSGWQSVANGAKPGPEDWYVAACTDRERDFNSNAVTLRTRATSRYPGQSLLDGATHFLVIPPPPIKRETKGPAVWPDGGTFEVSIPATQVSAYSGGPVARVADMTFKLIRTGVECVFVEMNSTQMHDYYAIGGHAWKIGDPIKRES